jgi:hypothetical protein
MLGTAAWLGLTLYSQPRARSEQPVAVRQFLERGLAGDSAALVTRAAAPQPVQWVLAAVRRDPATVREWARGTSRVHQVQRGDTVWVTLRRERSTPHCPFFSPLTAVLLARRGTPEPVAVRLLAVTSTCPRVPGATDTVNPR